MGKHRKQGVIRPNADRRWNKFLALVAYHGKTLKEISEATKIPLNTLSRWAGNKPKVFEKYRTLAEYLGISVERLFDDKYE